MENIQEVAAALVAAQVELSNPQKSKTAHVKSKSTGVEFDYSYTDFAEIIDIVRPVFAKHGLAMLHIMQQPAIKFICISRYPMDIRTYSKNIINRLPHFIKPCSK